MEIIGHIIFEKGSLLFSLFCLLFCLSRRVAADCECGYSTTAGNHEEMHVFTDLIETNFQKLDNISKDTDWARQEFNLTAKSARGAFGEMFAVDNVHLVSSADDSRNANEGDSGLHLTVQSSRVDDMVPVAEIDSSRLDLWWGSFRAGIKVPDVPGTCAAFFCVLCSLKQNMH